MGAEFEGQDLSESTFWGIDLSRSTLRDVNLTGVSMHNVWMIDTEIDGLIERLVINGVDVTEYVRAHDPWQPLRGMLRPTDRAGLLATWDELERAWLDSIDAARQLPDPQRHESVNGEWSFVQTLRHLVFGIDKWFSVPIAGEPFDPIGLPNSGSSGLDWPGVDRHATPSFDHAVARRADRMLRVRDYLEAFTDADVERQFDIIENGPHSAIDCVYTVFEEGFEHLRYARRDLALLGSNER